jgi:integrase
VNATFRTKAQAERWATTTEDRIRSGTWQDTSTAENRKLSDHLSWYLEIVSPKKAPGSLIKEESRIRVLSGHPVFRHCTLATLAPQTVTAYIHARQQSGISNGTIIRELGTLAHAIDAGIGLLRITLPHGNPVTAAKKTLRFTRALAVEDARNRRLHPAEEVALLSELGPVMSAAVGLYLETGMRREELCNARREHIRGNTLRIPEAKTGGRTIPLSPRALEILAGLPARLDGHLIGMRPDSVSRAFSRACVRAGIVGLRLHDLRHEAITRLFERGWTIPEVAAVSGHSDWKSLARYTQIDPEFLAEKMRVDLSPPRRRDNGSD